MSSQKSYYEILNVPKNATESEIKKAYRTLSLQFHPDRNKSPDARSIFQSLGEAYATLVDSDKRNQYDMELNGVSFNMNGGGIPEDMSDLGNIFNMMFGGGGMFPGGPAGIHVFPGPGMHRMHSHQPGMETFSNMFTNIHMNMQKPQPIIKSVRLTLEQAYLGCSLPVEIDRWVLHNDIKHTETETIYVPIHRGIDENEFIILREKGNIVNEQFKGDIKITIQIENTTIFRRIGLDLVYTKTLSLKESLCGFVMEIPHISGKKLTLSNINNRTVISPHTKKVIGDLGMVRDNIVGNLIIEFKIEFPEKLTDEQTAVLQTVL
jgi:DnaJ-class molecular chaperone